MEFPYSDQVYQYAAALVYQTDNICKVQLLKYEVDLASAALDDLTLTFPDLSTHPHTPEETEPCPQPVSSNIR